MPNTLNLYHGTTHDFAEIDVSRGKPFKDFHLTGTQGVIDEVDDYIRIQREHLEVRSF